MSMATSQISAEIAEARREALESVRRENADSPAVREARRRAILRWLDQAEEHTS